MILVLVDHDRDWPQVIISRLVAEAAAIVVEHRKAGHVLDQRGEVAGTGIVLPDCLQLIKLHLSADGFVPKVEVMSSGEHAHQVGKSIVAHLVEAVHRCESVTSEEGLSLGEMTPEVEPRD